MITIIIMPFRVTNIVHYSEKISFSFLRDFNHAYPFPSPSRYSNPSLQPPQSNPEPHPTSNLSPSIQRINWTEWAVVQQYNYNLIIAENLFTLFALIKHSSFVKHFISLSPSIGWFLLAVFTNALNCAWYILLYYASCVCLYHNSSVGLFHQTTIIL